MGAYFRRSVKIGGVRFNLSKSGIGMSTGIKGLRFGVSSKGKPYISGGAGGVYFRENIGSAKNTHPDYHTGADGQAPINQTGKKRNGFLKFMLWFLKFMVWLAGSVFLLAGTAFDDWGSKTLVWGWYYRLIPDLVRALLLPAWVFAPLIILVGKSGTMTRAVLELKRKIDTLVTENNLDAIQDILSEIKEKDFPKEYLGVLFTEAYPVFIKNALADGELSAQELAIIEELKSGLNDYQFEYMNSEAVQSVFSEMLDDNKITGEEEAALYSILDKIQIPKTAKDKIIATVSQYKKIVALYENGPSKIAVTISTLKALNCYYEGEASLLGKRKDRHGNYEYYEKGSGKLYVTDKDIQIMIDGHIVIGIDKIASLELDGAITRVIVTGRKTPFYIKAVEPVWLEALVKYIVKNR